MEVFEVCRVVNDHLINNREQEARNELIKLLDYHVQENIQYTPLINQLIKDTGLYPYLDLQTAGWRERFIYEAFKVDTGGKDPYTLHRDQSILLKKLIDGESIAVSAPTSFGKSFVIDAFIRIMRPRNVVIIVPTIALTDETRRRLYKKFAGDYKIITTAEVELGEKNIFIFPQERAIGYLDKLESIDILIVDEFYKASNSFDKDRSPSLVKAIIKLGAKSKQKYFLAPNISTLGDNPFTRDMEFIRLDFNTVFLKINEHFEEIGKDRQKKAEFLLKILKESQAKSLIYAGTYTNIDTISNLIIANFQELSSPLLSQFADWLGKNYDYTWSLTSLVKRGTGIHNGRLHRSLSQIQVKLFEEENGLRNIVSTSSIIEGVNTSAENVIIWMNKKGSSNLDDFTYRNIIGRGGRMFKHFVGKIFILDKPPLSEATQLDIAFPDEIKGDIDETTYEKILTRDQIAKIIHYREEMSSILGTEVYERLKGQGVFQSSNAELIRTIAIDMSQNQEHWNGLGFLNSSNSDNWDSSLYKIINLKPGGWETKSRTFVAFIKILKYNWMKTIPELLQALEPHDVGLDDFFKLERNVSFKFSALIKDVNILQKEILKDKHYDISRFVSWTSHAFLPSVVYQLEEYGLPRMISKKIHRAKVINFLDQNLTIHSTIDQFNSIGMNEILRRVTLDKFDTYILNYFYEGLQIETRSIDL